MPESQLFAFLSGCSGELAPGEGQAAGAGTALGAARTGPP